LCCLAFLVFCALQGLLICRIFGLEVAELPSWFPDVDEWLFADWLGAVAWSLTKIGLVLWGQGAWMAWSLAALLGSHGVSFVQNYLRGGEYKHANAGLGTVVLRPIGRVFFLQASLMAGGVLAKLLGLHGGTLVAFVALKICVDLFAHRREHWQMAEVAREGEPVGGAGGRVPPEPAPHTWELVRSWEGDLTSGGWTGEGSGFDHDAVSVPYEMKPIATPWRIRAENRGEGELNVIVWPVGARDKPVGGSLPAPLRGYTGEENLLSLSGPGEGASGVFRPVAEPFMLRFLVFGQVTADVVVERAVRLGSGQADSHAGHASTAAGPGLQ
jgi:hypothetical protein